MVKSFEEISKLLKESLSMNAARAKALTLIIFAMINCETVNMSKLSKHLKSDIKQASGYKRLQRFMKEVIFDQHHVKVRLEEEMEIAEHLQNI